MVGGLLVSASGQFILGIEDYIPVPYVVVEAWKGVLYE